MKFTAGYWQMRPGVTPSFATQIHDFQIGPNHLIAYTPTKKISHRGDTLNLALITVRVSSPMHNVIRIQAYHHAGGLSKSPNFTFYSQPNPVDISTSGEFINFSCGELSVRLEKENWRMQFLGNDKLLTQSGWRALGFVDTHQGRYFHEQLSLSVGECVYGLGERFTAFVKNGQSVDMWNEDGGTSSELAYKNIPFYLTNRGYGVFVNHPECVSFEVASEKVRRVQFSVPGEELDYFVIYGPSPKQILERYTALTGRPALPPAWSFGLWLTTSFTTKYDEETVTSFIQGMADRDIPLHVFHFDCFWMKEFHWCNFEWDNRCFPNPQDMLKRLKERGLKICVWINPYIAQRSALFDEGKEKGYLVKKRDGSVWQWDNWQAGMGLVDFTNPGAKKWFGDKLRALVDLGVDCFKTDFGERIPIDVVYYDGSDPIRMHNYYTFLYNQAVFEVLEEKLGKGEATLFARSATAGGQQFPVHWGGDSTATFESMAESLRGGLSLGISGFGFWSHDIGGFEQTASADVYKRWCAFGLLSSHSRLHGSSSYRVPWLFDEEAVDVLRFFTKLKCKLMPYLYQMAVNSHLSGVPLLRAMHLEFPGDPACDMLDRQYMLGDSLLVAPVFNSDGDVDFYLPHGRWTNYFTGEVVKGGQWRREHHTYMSLPLYVRENTILPVGENDYKPDYEYAKNISLHIFELNDGITTSISVPNQSGAKVVEFRAQRTGFNIQVEATGQENPWSILLRGINRITTIRGGTAVVHELGYFIAPDFAKISIEIDSAG